MRKSLGVVLGACVFFAIGWYLAVRGPQKSAGPEQPQIVVVDTNQAARPHRISDAPRPARAASTPEAEMVVQHPSETRLPGIPVTAAAAESIPTNGIQTAAAGIAPATALENMRTVIRQYASTFGGNPVGNNAEITSALNGGNPKQVNFLREDSRVNGQGELIDSWGTPYFFHQLSAKEMEIRSAGPDRRMLTADDLVIK